MKIDTEDRAYRRSSKIIIKYRFDPSGSWLATPTNDSPPINPWTQQPDVVKLWDYKLNRPAADRYLTPKQVKHEDSSFCTGPPAECADEDLEKFLKASQFSTASGNGRQIDLRHCKFFYDQEIKFRDPSPLSAVDHHLRRSLATQASVQQIVSDLRDFFVFLINNWDEDVDCFGEPNPGTPLKFDFASSPDALVEQLKTFRYAMELILRGEGCSLDWTMASIVAIRSSVRKHVKARCSGSPQARSYMEHLLNTAYAVPHLFGPMPASMETELARNMADRLKVQPEPILRKDSGSSDSQVSFIRKADSVSSSSAGSSNPQQPRFRRPRRQAKWKKVKKNPQPINPPKNARGRGKNRR